MSANNKLDLNALEALEKAAALGRDTEEELTLRISNHGVFCEASEPFIDWKHVDGPLLICSTGNLHWLTLGDRFRLWVGLNTIKELDERWKDQWFAL